METEFRAFVLLQLFKGLCKIVLQEVKKGDVVLLRDTRVVQYQGAISDEGVCCLTTVSKITTGKGDLPWHTQQQRQASLWA